MAEAGTAPRIPTWALDGSHIRDPTFGFSNHGEDSVTRRTGDREGHRAGLKAFEKKKKDLPLLENRTAFICSLSQ